MSQDGQIKYKSIRETHLKTKITNDFDKFNKIQLITNGATNADEE